MRQKAFVTIVTTCQGGSIYTDLHRYKGKEKYSIVLYLRGGWVWPAFVSEFHISDEAVPYGMVSYHLLGGRHTRTEAVQWWGEYIASSETPPAAVKRYHHFWFTATIRWPLFQKCNLFNIAFDIWMDLTNLPLLIPLLTRSVIGNHSLLINQIPT